MYNWEGVPLMTHRKRRVFQHIMESDSISLIKNTRHTRINIIGGTFWRY